MIVTYIKSLDREQKHPISTIDPKNKKYEFATVKIHNLFDFATLSSKYHILNRPFEEKYQDVQAVYNASGVNPYLTKKWNYLIVNFNNVRSKEEQQNIIDFFQNYNSIVIETASNDNVVNFNVRVIVETQLLSKPQLKGIVGSLNYQLSFEMFDEGIDTGILNTCRISAPSKGFVLAHHRGVPLGTKHLKINHTQYVKYKPEIAGPVFEELERRQMQVMHSSDGKATIKSGKETYYWYQDNPMYVWEKNGSTHINLIQSLQKRYNLSDYIQMVDYENMMTLEHNNEVLYQEVSPKTLSVFGANKEFATFRSVPGAVMCIKSPMNTGKTQIFKEGLKNTRNALFVTTRISLKQQYEAMIPYITNGKTRVEVVVYDSLHKTDISEFDYFIFDEFASLEAHAVSNCNMDVNDVNITKLAIIMQNPNNHILIIDACLDNNVFAYFNKRKIFFLENKHREKPIIESISKKEMKLALELANPGNPISVSCTSLQELEEIETILRNKNVNTMKITSETDLSDAEEIVNRFNQEGYSVMLFSPKLAIGVNLNCPVVQHIHYDNAQSVTPVTSVQMMRRNRNAQNISFCVTKRKQPRNVVISSIERDLLNKLKFVNYDDYGNPRLNKTGNFFALLNYYNNLIMQDYFVAFSNLALYNFNAKALFKIDPSEYVLQSHLNPVLEEDEWYKKYEIVEQFFKKPAQAIDLIAKHIHITQVDDFLDFFNYIQVIDNPNLFDLLVPRELKLKGVSEDVEDKLLKFDFLIKNAKIKLDNPSTFKNKVDPSGLELKSFGLQKHKTIGFTSYTFNVDFLDLYYKLKEKF